MSGTGEGAFGAAAARVCCAGARAGDSGMCRAYVLGSRCGTAGARAAFARTPSKCACGRAVPFQIHACTRKRARRFPCNIHTHKHTIAITRSPRTHNHTHTYTHTHAHTHTHTHTYTHTRSHPQVALLTGRRVVWPSVPCADSGPWVSPNPGSRRSLPLNVNLKFLAHGASFGTKDGRWVGHHWVSTRAKHELVQRNLFEAR